MLPITRNLFRVSAVWFAVVFSAHAFGQESVLYRDPKAPLDKRVDDLVSRMTLEEKVSQMMSDSPAIDRLGIPTYNWWNECLHGVARNGRATVFPEAIGLAATFDTELMSRIGTVISDEARAKYNDAVRHGHRNIYQGLTFWTPNINLFRDPRWGRGMETYGEDPYLTGRMAIAFIKALQGDDPKYFKVIATAKHYAVHSGPESLRHVFDAVASKEDLWDTYLPHFEAAVREGGAYSVMCAYNSIDGEPACANTRLLEDILRRRWKFPGYVVSDCGAIGDIYKDHKFSPTPEQGVAVAVKAGTDLNCGVEYLHLVDAVHKGLIEESEVDRAVRRLFVARFRLGLFDPPEMVKYASIPPSDNDSPAHRELALETARKSIVLLKNEGNLLPLSKSLKTIAVIGPNADDVDVLLGNYNGLPTAPITPLEGIRRKLGSRTRVIYARGSELAHNMPILETIPSSALLTDASSGAHGLTGEYFNTGNFDGRAHRPREMTYPNTGRTAGEVPKDPKPLFTRTDPQVDFHWWDGAPRAGMNEDDFGVRWTGYLAPTVSGSYQLGAFGMNAFELYLDDKRIVDFNNIHEASYQYAPVQLEAGHRYKIRLDYHEFANDASIRLVWAPPVADLRDDALSTASKADAIVMMLGLSPRLEGEEMKVPVEGFQGGDRVTLDIPRVQEDLLQSVAALGKPLVLVLLNGSAVAVNWAHDHVPAIVELWYPGQAGGAALADVLFGDYNPAGRLPVTFYKSESQLPPFTDYKMKGRTYRFFDGDPLYAFGYGLSYTTFAYPSVHVPEQAATGDPVKVDVEVQNTGKRAGEEVVELYISRKGADANAPKRSLEGFRRVSLRAGEKKTVSFVLDPRQLSHVTAQGQRTEDAGTFEIYAGGGQPGTGASAAPPASIRIVGSPKPLD